MSLLLCSCGPWGAVNQIYRRTQNRFKHSTNTIHRKFHEVLLCVVKMSADYIKPKDPDFRMVHPRIRNDKRAYPHLKDCIGAIDGTDIRVLFPMRYIRRTGAITQNVMAICDFDMHFTYASIGQPGSMHNITLGICTTFDLQNLCEYYAFVE